MTEPSSNLRMPIKRPDASHKSVFVIASMEDHLGNCIAEGLMEEADYYPKLVDHYRSRAKESETDLFSYREGIENAIWNQFYKTFWMTEYLDYNQNTGFSKP